MPIKNTLSVCIIAKDEEVYIAKCIDSVKVFADEIIVVDTGSIDDTISIAKQRGAKVFSYTWDFNFSNARNFSISKANGEWLFIIDADEEVDKQFAIKLNKLKQKPADTAYLIDITENSDLGLSTFTRFSLFPNNTKIKYLSSINESIDSTLIDNAIIQKKLIGNIIHNGYKDSFSRKKRALRNRDVILKNGNISQNPQLLNSLANSYLLENNIIKAIDIFKETLKINNIRENYPNLNQLLLINIILSYLKLNETKLALNWIDNSTTLYPNSIEFKSILADILIQQDKFSEAINLLETVINSSDSNSCLYFNFEKLKSNSLTKLGLCYSENNDIDNALQFYKKAYIEEPDNFVLCGDIAILLLEKVNIEEALKYINSSILNWPGADVRVYILLSKIMEDYDGTNNRLSFLQNSIKIFKNEVYFLEELKDIYRLNNNTTEYINITKKLNTIFLNQKD